MHSKFAFAAGTSGYLRAGVRTLGNMHHACTIIRAPAEVMRAFPWLISIEGTGSLLLVSCHHVFLPDQQIQGTKPVSTAPACSSAAP